MNEYSDSIFGDNGFVLIVIAALVVVVLLANGGKVANTAPAPDYSTTTITITDNSRHTCVLAYCPEMR